MVECACYTGARGEALIGDPESPTTLARLSCAIRMQGYRCWEGEPQIWVRGGLRDGTDLAVALAYLAACGQRECPPRCPAGSLGLSGVVEDGPMAGLGLREAAYLLALQPSPRTDIQLARLSPRRVGGGPLFISPLASTGRR